MSRVSIPSCVGFLKVYRNIYCPEREMDGKKDSVVVYGLLFSYF